MERSILADFEFTLEHCDPQDANMTNCEHHSISEILNRYRMQVCIRPRTAGGALTRGTKLLDAALTMSIPSMRRNPILINEEQLRQIPDVRTTEKYIFILFYYLVTHGRLPNEQDDMPAALRSFLLAERRPIDICHGLASFPLSQVAHPWIRTVATLLEPKMVHLLAPQVMNFQTMLPFVKYKIYKKVPIHVLDAAMAVRAFCKRGPVWDSHPLTMTAAFYQATGGNFYQNLINLIYQVYTPPQIVDMMKQKFIPDVAITHPGYMQFLTWDDKVFEPFTDSVFFTQVISVDEVQ
jgi:hypothetical protein